MGRRTVGLGVAAGVLLAGAVAVPAHANTPVGCSDLALIQAINDSNSGANDHILDLTSYCVYTLTDADGTLPVITQALTIHGHNATIRRDPNAGTDFRIFEVGGTSLTMDTLTVMNGHDSFGGGVLLNTNGGSLTGTDVNFQGNTANGFGGAIEVGASTTLSLTRGTITDNRSASGGGGIDNTGATAITLDSVTMSRNLATEGHGAALYLDTSQPSTITNSTISNNTALTGGGGLFITDNTPLTVTGSRIISNRVANSNEGGGGIDNGSGVVTIMDSTISGNTVTTNTGTSDDARRGGGIKHVDGQLTLDHTTVANNRVIGESSGGGGIAAVPLIGPSTLTLQNNTTVTGNLVSGRYAQGGGLHTDNTSAAVTVFVNGSHIDANKVTGTGSAPAGIYNNGGTWAVLTNSTVNNNTAPIAPAPGGIYTTVAITNTSGSAFTGNTPTNCLLSPAPVTGCVG
ncbi:hypothetical protein ABZ845_02440 [Streptomyces sp. NPDC047022]|uniref:hypothetical protein n=1 Tax=Streptomyces sp. NPDC047022 TaxID=3155737 RepID=UPI0033D30E94